MLENVQFGYKKKCVILLILQICMVLIHLPYLEETYNTIMDITNPKNIKLNYDETADEANNLLSNGILVETSKG